MSSRTSASPCSRAAIQSRCSTSSSATPSRRLRAEASAAAPRVSGRRWEALLWLGPSLALIGGVVFYPAVALVRASLGRYSITGVYQGSVGAENYARLLEQPALPTVLANTAVWVTAVVSITVVISLALAQLLNQDFPGRALVRWALIVPWAASLIMTSTLFVWIYDYYFGALNQLLMSLHVLTRPVDWLAEDTIVMGAMIAVGIFVSLPFTTYVLLAGLAGIPGEVYEAARVDGASTWATYRLV
ncbi:MAG: ABC transporter permease, partial [Candidatus Rokuibacteriota bacterium]